EEQKQKEEKDEADRKRQEEQEAKRRSEAARRCDELAANPNDSQRMGDGVAFDALKPQAREAAANCELAMAQNPLASSWSANCFARSFGIAENISISSGANLRWYISAAVLSGSTWLGILSHQFRTVVAVTVPEPRSGSTPSCRSCFATSSWASPRARPVCRSICTVATASPLMLSYAGSEGARPGRRTCSRIGSVAP